MINLLLKLALLAVFAVGAGVVLLHALPLILILLAIIGLIKVYQMLRGPKNPVSLQLAKRFLSARREEDHGRLQCP